MKKKKIVKLIDILCLMSLNEKIPRKIKYDNQIYNYCDAVKDYYYTFCGINVYLFRTLFWTPITFLNDEIEVLEVMEKIEDIEEFEDIEEWCDWSLSSKEKKIKNKVFDLQRYILLLKETQNQLIKNQKKIIEILKKEGI